MSKLLDRRSGSLKPKRRNGCGNAFGCRLQPCKRRGSTTSILDKSRTTLQYNVVVKVLKSGVFQHGREVDAHARIAIADPAHSNKDAFCILASR